jgi:hypothetical protein
VKPLDAARKALGSAGKFPVSTRICYALPVAGLEAISAVRVMMALLWIRDVTPGASKHAVIEVDLAELRSASGYGEAGSYRQVIEGLSKLWQVSFMDSSGIVIEVFDFATIVDSDEGKVCRFRMTPEFEEAHSKISTDGYGMVDMDEVLRLARSIDFPIYLRACAVRKRRRKVFDISRPELYCLSSKDPDGPIGGAVRSVKTSVSRVGAILRANAQVDPIEGLGKDRVKGLKVSIEAS